MAVRGSLREYQDEVLKKMETARQRSLADQSMYFGFIAGSVNFLIDANLIVEMTPTSKVAPIPLAKPWVEGAANIRGSVYTITDFSLLFGGAKTRAGIGKFIVCSDELMVGAALHIEGLAGLFQKDALVIEPLQPEVVDLPHWIVGQSTIDGKKYFLIGGENFCADTRFARLQISE